MARDYSFCEHYQCLMAVDLRNMTLRGHCVRMYITSNYCLF